MRGGEAEYLPIAQIHISEVRLADADRIRQHRLKYRIEVPRRARDHTEHLGGRRLLLQRLRQLARAGLHLVEQTHVFDRDHRLVGKGGDQLDLLVGERPNRLALQDENPDRRFFA